MSKGVWRRRLGGFAIVCAAGAAIATNTSCILIDPPPDLPVPAVRRPTILRTQANPPADTPLAALLPNGEFDLQLELPDPTQSVTWAAFLDYGLDDAFTIDAQNIVGSPNAPDIVKVFFNLPPQRVAGTQCHYIHFVVALSSAFKNPNDLHDTDPNLSDTIDWIYVPGGNPAACTTYDGGGNDGAFPDDGATDDSGDGSGD